MTMKERLEVHRRIVAENKQKTEEWKSCTLSDAIRKFGADSVISIETKEYGQFWLGKARFALSHIRYESLCKRAKIDGHRIIICG